MLSSPSNLIASQTSWKLGPHRLICGDSTDPYIVASLMCNEQADLLFTDPPYGASYKGVKTLRKPIAGDDLPPSQLGLMLTAAFQAAPLKAGGAFYVCSTSGPNELVFRLALIKAGLTLKQTLVWVKHHFALSHRDYQARHEAILYGWKEGAAHYFVGDRTQTTVWEYKKPHKSPFHPTTKPIELVKNAILNSSRQGDIVYDGFGGSGTTLLACEHTGRCCRMVEIEPEHCQVVIEQWQALTGKQAVLLIPRPSTRGR